MEITTFAEHNKYLWKVKTTWNQNFSVKSTKVFDQYDSVTRFCELLYPRITTTVFQILVGISHDADAGVAKQWAEEIKQQYGDYN